MVSLSQAKMSAQQGSGYMLSIIQYNCLFEAQIHPNIVLSNHNFSLFTLITYSILFSSPHFIFFITTVKSSLNYSGNAEDSLVVVYISLVMERQEREEGLQGVRIGHYVLGRTIGKGTFARVKEARHEQTGLAVAVKIINKLKMKNKNMISKVKREIKILKFVNHPNIIKLYEVLDTTSDIFVVMQLAKGGELYEYIEKHNVHEPQMRNFFQQIIEAVEFTHLNLVAHRDLKPQNVLLDSNNRVKIADFGLSNIMRDGKMLKTSCGSLNYAAPEIIGKRTYEGTTVDVWSLGVILYTMLVGCLPFDEEIVSILYRKIEKAEYQIPDNVSPLARDLIQRMLRANPCQRIRVSEIKRHPWLRTHLPIYASISFFCTSLKEPHFSIDNDLLDKVRSYRMDSLRSVSDIDRIATIIRRRMDDSFVTAYQLLKDEQQRAAHEHTPPIQASSIFSPLSNRLPAVTDSNNNTPKHTFGWQFSKSSKIVMGVILDVFEEFAIDFFVKNSDYCVLCTYYTPLRTSRRRSSTQFEEDKIFGYQDEQRFIKEQIKFTLQLYTRPDDLGVCILDLKVSQGHPLVFLSFCTSFCKRINALLQQ